MGKNRDWIGAVNIGGLMPIAGDKSKGKSAPYPGWIKRLSGFALRLNTNALGHDNY
jgi:hypothetical protein